MPPLAQADLDPPELHPFERSLLPDPYVANDEDAEKDQHLDQSEAAESLELYGPWKQENRFHIEDHEQYGDDVITHGVASAGAVVGIDAALVRHQLHPVGTLRADNSRDQQRDGNQDADDGEKEKDGNVILRHEPPSSRDKSETEY